MDQEPMEPADLDLPELDPIDLPGGVDDPLLTDPPDSARPEIEPPGGFPDLGGLPEAYERPEPVRPGPGGPDEAVPPGLGDLTDELVDLGLDDAEPAPAGPSTADSGPVDLPMAEPIDPGQEPPRADGPSEPGIDLSLDPGAVPESSTDLPDELIDLDDGPTGLPSGLSTGNAWLTGGIIAAGLAGIGLAAPVLARLRALRQTTPPDLAAHLEGFGIDARVEHLDLLGLESLMQEGRTVLLSTDGQAGVDVGAVVQLDAVDRAGGLMHMTKGDGEMVLVDVDRFEEAWADSANQVVLATGPTGRVALVPVELAGL